MHTLILTSLIFYSSRVRRRSGFLLLLALIPLPLIRIVSLSLPLANFPLVYWFLLTSLPLFVTALMVARLLGWGWRDLGLSLSLKGAPVQLLIAATGLFFGYVEYQILRPAPLIERLSWQTIWLPAVILLISTGFLEELLFRRVLQRPAIKVLGVWPGITYGALLFAVFHIGYRSPADVLFVFLVGIFFGWVVWKTHSLVGVTLAHGLTNIALFLVIPFYASGVNGMVAGGLFEITRTVIVAL
ncbi:MAG TPA: CPBP family intramembrane metalloprotease [Chloroflexota bacterium]|nr:CPBP family intramembrane metalloprotease [Chloroflexota bacterium]